MPKKLLIVEDDRFLANAYKLKLEQSGHEVMIAGNGQEAIDFLSKFSPDLILLDLVMPIKDGFTTLEELKKSSDWKTIPVVVLSSLSQKEDIDRAMGLGAMGYITKDHLSLEDLLARIELFINSQLKKTDS